MTRGRPPGNLVPTGAGSSADAGFALTTRDELDFLPAALRIARSPVHPLPRFAAATLVALVLGAAGWTCLAEVDIVIQAPGRIVATDRSKTIQTLERGVVRSILVRDGDHVRPGQALVVLDSTIPQADQVLAQQQLHQAQSDRERAEALLQIIDQLDPSRDQVWPPELPGDAGQPALRSEWQQIALRQARLSAETQRRQAEVATAQQGVLKLEAALPLSLRREQDILALASQGFIAGHVGQDRTRERIELEQELRLQRARAQEALAGLTEAQASRAAHTAETRHALTERAAQARLRAASASQELAKANQRSRLMTLVAPVSGTVQQLAAHTIGGVATEAQALMVIVPDDDDPSGIAAEVELDSRDIGFVALGQVARVKLEAFPYTRYGTLEATIDFVGADAIVTQHGSTVFPMRLRLRSSQMDIDGLPTRVSAGMVLTAEVHTGRRRLIEYLLSPLQRTGAESLRER